MPKDNALKSILIPQRPCRPRGPKPSIRSQFIRGNTREGRKGIEKEKIDGVFLHKDIKVLDCDI